MQLWLVYLLVSNHWYIPQVWNPLSHPCYPSNYVAMGDHNSFGNSCGSTCVHDHCNIWGHRPGLLFVSCNLHQKRETYNVRRAYQAGRSDILTYFSSHCNIILHDYCYYILLSVKKIVVKLKCLHKEQELLCISWAMLWVIVLVYHNTFSIMLPIFLQRKKEKLWHLQNATEL